MISASPHILVVYKKTRYEHYVVDDGDASVQELIDRDDESVASLMEAHRTHRANLQRVVDYLEAQGLSYESHFRGDVEATDDFDLVVTVGGDGTVLDISHRIDDVPVLAINSHPATSVGYFCAGEAGEFPELLERTLETDWQPFELSRFRVRINDEVLPFPVLNDVLIGHCNPAAVSRYLLRVGDGPAEEQRSSGIWVATPAGSTAAIRSAGGFVLPLESGFLEYLVREPYPLVDHPYHHAKGIHPIGDRFEVVSKMKGGRIYLDGPHISRDFSVGDTVSIEAGAPSLRIFGLVEQRRAR